MQEDKRPSGINKKQEKDPTLATKRMLVTKQQKQRKEQEIS